MIYKALKSQKESGRIFGVSFKLLDRS